MLLRFRVQNHRSLRDEQELSLIAGSLKDHPTNLCQPAGIGESVVRVAAIYGANASGKTNLWDALRYMRHAVEQSQRAWDPEGGVPRHPFLLDAEAESQTSLYEVDILVSDVRYQYGFILDSNRVHEEWLYSFANGRRSTLFTRSGDAEPTIKPGKSLTGTRAIEKMMRPNSLFLSAAVQNNQRMLLPIYHWFSSVRFASPDLTPSCPMITRTMLSENRPAIEALLRSADLGIQTVSEKEHEPDAAEQTLMRTLRQAFRERGAPMQTEEAVNEWPQDIMFHHRARGPESIPLSLSDESRGTVIWFCLAGPILKTLSSGGLLLVDELDASLHPSLSLEVIRIFNSPALNPKNAQLVFNTHDTNLLGADVLRRDQIWFTEKDDAGTTHLYPLTDFHPRQYENLERGYLQGRYGAIPFLGSVEFLKKPGENDA